MCALPPGPARPAPTTDAADGTAISASLPRPVHCLALPLLRLAVPAIASLFLIAGHRINWRLRRSIA